MSVKPTPKPVKAPPDAEDPVCAVSVTCSQPAQNGEMAVECSYRGDAQIAAFLLQRALHYLEDQIGGVARQFN